MITKTDLLNVSRAKPHDFYLENSMGNEISYSLQHYRRFRELFGIITGLPLKSGRLLDIGTSPFTFLLREKTVFDVHTVDFTERFSARCAGAGIEFRQFNITGQGLPYPAGHFDIVVFSEVFEHLLADPVRIMRKMHEMLKPGGFLVFGTPNLASLQKRLLLAFNRPILDRPTWEINDDSIHGFGHNRLYVLRELSAFMAEAGLSIERAEYSGAMDFTNTGDRLYEKAAKLLLLLPKFLIPSFRWGIHIVASSGRTK